MAAHSPAPADEPYTCYRAGRSLAIDGRLDEEAWLRAPRSPRFVDVVDGAPALYDSRAAALWDDDYLYVGFWLEEPCVQASLTERDSLIFLENDVEVFIDGGDCYYEFEINALGTIYEVFFIWRDAYTRGGRFDVPEFELLQPGAFSFGGNHDRSGEHFWRGTHPRGVRWAFTNWDMPGLRTAVHVDGQLNDCSAPHHGWTVELAFPWAGMGWLAGERALPPREGDEWRIFFGRYERLRLNGGVTNVGWAWTPIGSNDNHLPERFTRVRFSRQTVEKLDRV
jgi:hypothetical protein